MEWIEVTGETLDEAEDHALQMLGIDREDAEFEVMEKPKSSLFKRKNHFRVRARIMPKTAASKVKPEKNQRRRRSDRSSDSRDSRDSRNSRDSRDSQGRGRRNRNDEDRPHRPLMEKEIQEEIIENFFQGLLTAWGLKGKIKFDWPKDHICDISITGSGLNDLIGENAEILEALEMIARIPLKKKALDTRYAQIYLDIENFRTKRSAALAEFALKLAKEVKESGKSKILEPMDNRDRKIVHDAIGNLDGVVTLSEGERDSRRVKIFVDSEES